MDRVIANFVFVILFAIGFIILGGYVHEYNQNAATKCNSTGGWYDVNSGICQKIIQ